jgi:hypothetical protein
MMRIVLLYFENMGLAVHYNVADFGMIYDVNGTAATRFFELFVNFRDAEMVKAFLVSVEYRGWFQR